MGLNLRGPVAMRRDFMLLGRRVRQRRVGFAPARRRALPSF